MSVHKSPSDGLMDTSEAKEIFQTQTTESIPWEPIYHSIETERLWPSDPTISNFNLEHWPEEGIKTILDAGCGDGKNLAWLIEQGFFGLGVDASTTALHRCQNYLNAKGLKSRYLLLSAQQLESLPFLDGELPAAICIDVLGHTQNPSSILVELSRVLQSGGLLYLSLFHPDDSCRLGLRIRPGENPGDYWYTPSVPSQSAPDLEYYYHFYTENEVRQLFQDLPVTLLELKRQAWNEPPHEKYREEEHTHVSWFALLKRI
ncbi:class I SAM-dependent methyltransferase [Okeanomitos corallinicola TIOX110]|uniref:Class I SAM-dependent methyltransferase n=1 Tax=Okeanomitos corallinicola TIOX110 TaxID=3133117 RepID=A0ABZ2UZ03_9CYAN